MLPTAGSYAYYRPGSNCRLVNFVPDVIIHFHALDVPVLVKIDAAYGYAFMRPVSDIIAQEYRLSAQGLAAEEVKHLTPAHG